MTFPDEYIHSIDTMGVICRKILKVLINIYFKKIH